MTHSLPLKIGLLPSSSARIQPIDQTSTAREREALRRRYRHSLAVVYRLFDNMTSGALYHLVATSAVSLIILASADRLTLRQLQIVILPLLARYRLVSSCQPEVADLKLAIGVDKEVARFQISVDDIGRMDVLRSAA